MPHRATEDAIGFDVYAPSDGVIPNDSSVVKIGLGFKAALPKGFGGFLIPRSGLATKSGVILANIVGLIDPDYRGEWILAVTCHGDDYVYYKAGDRLAQFAILPALLCEVRRVQDLDATSRGEGGFGSTDGIETMGLLTK